MGLRANHSDFRRWLVAAALLPLAAAACDSPTQLPQTRTTTLNVYLKDKAGDVDSVWVQVNDVVLMGDSGQISVLDAPTDLINVTALQDSVTSLAQGVDLTSTSFHEVRIMLGGAVLQSGTDVYTLGGAEHPGGLPTTGTLKCPSCDQTGIKVKLSGDLQMAEGDNGLLLDFDVSQSFGHQAGNSGKWVMHPVIHGAGAEPSDIEGGTAQQKISGTVAMAVDTLTGDTVSIPMCGGEDRTLAEFVPTATASTLTDGDGNPLMFSGTTKFSDDGEGGGSWTFGIAVNGDDAYALGYEPDTVFDTEQLVWTAEVDPTSVTVTGTDGGTGVAYVVTAVTCEPLTTP